jgi:acyl-CoA reductase-like NAD-dependent aldehyde dehydrogenase
MQTTTVDVARAVETVAASQEFEPWPLWARREALTKAAVLVSERAEYFADLISTEGCKTITEARREALRCTETLRLSAAASSVLTGETIPFDDSARGGDKIGWYTRKPVGVVAAITPFNDPLNLVAHKIGPALIAGNGVVLKPATTTPLTAIALVDLLIEAGVPESRIAVVCGAAEIGEALVTHPRVDLVSFTGGPRTAQRITEIAGPRKLLMELGGNNPTIVCSDADVHATATAVVAGAFGVAGQNCLSVQRVYIHSSIYNEVLAQVSAHASALSVGEKANPSTDIGPLVTEAEAIRVEEWVEEAVLAGARVHAGGRRCGPYYWPTVLTDVPVKAKVVRDEIFGPVVTLSSFDDIADAICQANNSDYALQAGIFTNSIDQALRIADRLSAGAVVVNETSDVRIDAMPFGGFKRSGIGREGVRYAVEAMTEPKSLIINPLH